MEKLNVKVNIEEKLYLNKYKSDTVSHLCIKDKTVCAGCKDKPCTYFCPAAVYEWKEERIIVGFEGCMECGACRIACPFNNIEWKFPRGGTGIQFKLA
jgi:ferredoxin like protein